MKKHLHFFLFAIAGFVAVPTLSSAQGLGTGGATAQATAGYCWNLCVTITDHITGEQREACEAGQGANGVAMQCGDPFAECLWSNCTWQANDLVPKLLELRGRPIDDAAIVQLVSDFPDALIFSADLKKVEVLNCEGKSIGFVAFAAARTDLFEG